MAMLATWLWLLFYWWSLLLIKGLLAVGRIVKGCFFIPLGGERWSWWRRCRRRGPRRCGGAEVGSRTSDQLPVFMIGTWWVIRNLSKVPKMIPPSLQWGWRDEERNLSQDWRRSQHSNQSWRFTSFLWGTFFVSILNLPCFQFTWDVWRWVRGRWWGGPGCRWCSCCARPSLKNIKVIFDFENTGVDVLSWLK